MKILYAIQGTGNGHVARAQELIPVLKKYAEVDILISGTQTSIELDYPIKYRRKGLSIVSGRSGRLSLLATWKELDLIRFFKDLFDLPVKKYDLVITDFEALSAWSAKLYQIPCFEMSHQRAVMGKNAPRSSTLAPFSRLILKYFIPSDHQIGFHFRAYDKNTCSPLIRSLVRNADVSDKGHYTVYLPAFDPCRLAELLSEISSTDWQIFTKEIPKRRYSNVSFKKVGSHDFVESIASSRGVLCGAGFETPSEALYLGKKLMVVPMKGQFEQECNAKALELMGVRTLKRLNKKNLIEVKKWVRTPERVHVDYSRNAEDVIVEMLNEFQQRYSNNTPLFNGI